MQPHLIALTETQRLAEVARQGLRMVAEGEDKTIEGWLIYGRALSEGRKLFPSDEQFGRWVKGNLPDTEQKERETAMWAAADEAAFAETRRLHPRVRTVRGLHAKWKEAQRPELQPEVTREEPTEADLRRMDILRNTINHPTTETHLRANAQRKLNEYLERFGPVSPKASPQGGTSDPSTFRSGDDLADEIMRLVVELCPTHPRVRSLVKDAIIRRHRFGMGMGSVLSFLQQIKDQPPE